MTELPEPPPDEVEAGIADNHRSGQLFADLLSLARAGDQDAQEGLLKRFLPQLQQWVMFSRVGSMPADAVEFTRNIVLHALQRLEQSGLQDERVFLAHLRQSFLQQVLDEIRRSRRAPLRTPFAEAIFRDYYARYAAALERLKPEDCQAIVGRIEFRLSFEELSQALGQRTVGETQGAIRNALARLTGEMSVDPKHRDELLVWLTYLAGVNDPTNEKLLGGMAFGDGAAATRAWLEAPIAQTSIPIKRSSDLISVAPPRTQLASGMVLVASIAVFLAGLMAFAGSDFGAGLTFGGALLAYEGIYVLLGAGNADDRDCESLLLLTGQRRPNPSRARSL